MSDEPKLSALLDFEARLRLSADKLRNNLISDDYKHLMLGLMFLEYISDSFEEMLAKLVAGRGDCEGANPKDPDEYRVENVFLVARETGWSELQRNAKRSARWSKPCSRTLTHPAPSTLRDTPRSRFLNGEMSIPAIPKHGTKL